ncbi:acyl carrier protein [Nocardia sp. CDC159]|uniref:Acyl carrier protein n=1 Tax=Nocardia pulmonis TaxID=2951408 RepID=A0A9X2IW67_9NOCA|nr:MULTISPECIES: acyl carrier protein [Nocardia]MCM6773963.1 acyl carrier protein [Nocardia pulmonis]MCM6786850.1 acyl carrier protein [Nocardia sp. CDC159]
MDNNTMERELLEVVATEVERINDLDDTPAVSLSDTITDDLALDSLGVLELVLRLQSAFSVSLTEDEVVAATTVGDLLKLLNSKNPVLR